MFLNLDWTSRGVRVEFQYLAWCWWRISLAFRLMAVLVMEEIDSRAASSIVHVSLGIPTVLKTQVLN